jgi:site-specific DNA-methyltransferase (adenine-specific)
MVSPYYKDSSVEIYHGDCHGILAVLEMFIRIDVVVTDPPYGISDTAGGPESRAREKGRYTNTAWDDDVEYVGTVCAPMIQRCCTIARSVAVTCGRTNLWLYPAANDVGMFYQPAATGVSFWGRPTWQPILFYGTAPNNGEQLRPLHYILTEASPKNGHPCPKPLGAWRWLVSKTSRETDLILDPFLVSGTTLRAAKELNRKAIGIEINEAYCEIAAKRCESIQAGLFDTPVVKTYEPQSTLFGE